MDTCVTFISCFWESLIITCGQGTSLKQKEPKGKALPPPHLASPLSHQTNKQCISDAWHHGLDTDHYVMLLMLLVKQSQREQDEQVHLWAQGLSSKQPSANTHIH